MVDTKVPTIILCCYRERRWRYAKEVHPAKQGRKAVCCKRNLAGESACSLAGELGCSDSQVRSWVKAYQAEGEVGLEQKKKPGNRLSRYERRKELSYEGSLQYQVELLKRGLVRKDAEVLRLKKRNERKGGDARKR